VFVGRGVAEGRGVFVGTRVSVAVGRGVLVDVGAAGAAALQADRTRLKMNITDNNALTFGGFIFLSSI